MYFSPEGTVDIIYEFRVRDKNSLLAIRSTTPRRRRRRRKRKMLQNIMKPFERTGSVAYENKDRTKSILQEENEFQVMPLVSEHPHMCSTYFKRLEK